MRGLGSAMGGMGNGLQDNGLGRNELFLCVVGAYEVISAVGSVVL